MPRSIETEPTEPNSPANFAELRDRLASGSLKLPRRLQQVAAYALAHPDDVALGTVAKIAEDAGVQPSALIRFGQALGYTGFTDLQAVFRERLLSQVSNYDERMMSLRATGGSTSKAAALLDGLCKSATQSIGQLHGRIDIQRVEQATRLLADAETIYLVAQRRSFPITSYLSYAFGKLGIRNILVGSALGTDAETISFATGATRRWRSPSPPTRRRRSPIRKNSPRRACRWSSSRTRRSAPSPPSRASGSKWLKPISRDFARCPPVWRSP